MISDTRELTLDCPAQGLKPIIRFAYSGSLLVTKRNAVATMIAAEVTKMKEVQEICAGIAVKEYGWVEKFSGEKTPALIQKLRQVLLIHAPCFTSAIETNGISDEANSQLPFANEVENEFAEHLPTYRQLARKLLEAETITLAAAVRKKTTQCDVTKKVSVEEESRNDVAHNEIDRNSENIESQSAEDEKKTKSASSPTHEDSCAPLPVEKKQPEAHGDNNNGEKHGISATGTSAETNKAQSDKEIKVVEAEAETTSNQSTATQASNSAIKKTPRKHVPPPAPRPKSTPESVEPKNNIRDKAPDSHNDAAASPAPATRPVNSPAPRVKPRASMKMKKAPPPPPSAATPEKPSAPPRPAKVPQKVPPPRPKPPVKKTTSVSETGESQNIKKNEDYDDSLNPFV